jgi:hypothetical protein
MVTATRHGGEINLEQIAAGQRVIFMVPRLQILTDENSQSPGCWLQQWILRVGSADNK